MEVNQNLLHTCKKKCYDLVCIFVVEEKIINHLVDLNHSSLQLEDS